MVDEKSVEEIIQAVRDMTDETELRKLIRDRLEEAYMNGYESAGEEF